MAFTINTNIASLQSQEYLRLTHEFQNKTINRVTSGLRIISSGDDAAGLAIANSFRSDRAVLAQGVRNANDGLSTLQTIDGGINNISQLLDRARTLAAQSASGTFNGDRSVLNSEFQSVILEIDRQAQAIGLNTGGTFAKELSVFIGGGRGSTAEDQIANGSLSVDLSNSTVDNQSLGLQGVQAVGKAGTDIGTGSAHTAVAGILADQNNRNDLSNANFSDFYFRGPGFSDSGRIRVSVPINGVTDTTTLITAINDAIDAAGAGSTASATAFKNANIVASVNTDAQGRQQLAFTSANAAFQVEAGDKMANGLLGNFAGANNPQGASLDTTCTGAANTAAGVATFGSAGAGNIVFRFQGANLAAPVDLSLTVTSATTVSEAITNLASMVTANTTLAGAGITLTGATAGQPLQFTSRRGEKFTVEVTGDIQNRLGMGSFKTGAGNATDYATITGAVYSTADATGTATLEFSINGAASNGNAVAIDLTAGDATAAAITGTDNAATVNLSGGGNAQYLRLIVDGTLYEADLTNGAAVQKAVIANTINATVGSNIATVLNNQIVLTSTTKGSTSSIEVVDAATTAGTILGLSGSASGANRSDGSIVDALNNAFASDSELTAAGLQASAGGGQITIASQNGTHFRVNPRGSAETAASTYGTASVTAGGPYTINNNVNDMLLIAVDGVATPVDLTAGNRTAAQIVADINTAVGAVVASVITAGGQDIIKLASTTTGAASSLVLTATANSAYSTLGLNAGTYSGKTSSVGFGVGGATFTGNAASAAPADNPAINSGGSSESTAFTFTPVAYGGDDQTITISANNTADSPQSHTFTLSNDSTSRAGRDIDQAIHYINGQIQQSNNDTLKQVVAVKVNDAGVEKIQFLSTLGEFKSSIGTNAHATGFGSQGLTDTSTRSAGGGASDISTQSGAERAVSALATAVARLGGAQAVVGKGQNQFNFAISLAQTQISNLAASESRIRDADLAAEAGNLTRAQILLQAGVAALAQANVAPQVVLSLLQG